MDKKAAERLVAMYERQLGQQRISYEGKIRRLQAFVDEQRLRILVLESRTPELSAVPVAKAQAQAGDFDLLDRQLAAYAADFAALYDREGSTEAEWQAQIERGRAELELERAERSADHDRLIELLIRMLENRYPQFRAQLPRTKSWARAIAERVGWDSSRLDLLEQIVDAADLGMLALPDGILSETGALPGAAWQAIIRHPDQSLQLIARTALGRTCAAPIRHHHERFDGRGYPGGLAGVAIPIESRILALAGAYVAMTSPRPFRPAMAPLTARLEIKKARGTAFDPELCDLFLDIFDQGQLVDPLDIELSRLNSHRQEGLAPPI